MSSLQEYMAGFRLNYEKFLVGCDALEEEGLWPMDELGEMDVYFANDLACVIIRLIAADGVFAEEEIDFLNGALGTNYTVEELESVFNWCGDIINTMFEREIDESIAQLTELNPDLAAIYKQMLELIAQIVIKSDGVITESEKAIANQLLAVIHS